MAADPTLGLSPTPFPASPAAIYSQYAQALALAQLWTPPNAANLAAAAAVSAAQAAAAQQALQAATAASTSASSTTPSRPTATAGRQIETGSPSAVRGPGNYRGEPRLGVPHPPPNATPTSIPTDLFKKKPNPESAGEHKLSQSIIDMRK